MPPGAPGGPALRRLALLPLFAAAPLVAQGMPKTPPGAADPARATAGTYQVDPAHTQIGCEVDHLGFSSSNGFFADPTDKLTGDPARPASARLVIDIPPEQGRHDLFRVGQAPAQRGLLRRRALPFARFVSTRIEPRGQGATVTGNLTLRGVTKPATLRARFVGAGAMLGKGTVGFRAEGRIKRSEFDTSYGLPLVSDEVLLTINAAFDKPAAGTAPAR